MNMYRVGSKQPRNVYRVSAERPEGEYIGVFFNEVDAKVAVDAMNWVLRVKPGDSEPPPTWAVDAV